MLSLPSNLSDVVHISVYVAFVFQRLYFCNTQYSVAHLSLLSIKKGELLSYYFLFQNNHSNGRTWPNSVYLLR